MLLHIFLVLLLKLLKNDIIMEELSPNTIIELTNGKQCRVIEELGRGGQGIVYKVEYEGIPHALKWYIVKNKPAFYANLENNVMTGAPNDSFLWPLAVSKPSQYGSFGYIMKLRPSGYEEIG